MRKHRFIAQDAKMSLLHYNKLAFLTQPLKTKWKRKSINKDSFFMRSTVNCMGTKDLSSITDMGKMQCQGNKLLVLGG